MDMTLNKNVLKNIGGEITDGILLNGDAQKIKVITGGEITCPHGNSSLEFGVHFYLHGNSCAGLKGLRPRPGIKYYADVNSCASHRLK
jgi:hypothetical protein